MSNPADEQVVRSLTELLAIARTAMPEYLYGQDSRVYRARQLIGTLAQVSVSGPPPTIPVPMEMMNFAEPQMPSAKPPWDITAGLDAFMASDLAPATRTEAVMLILRDWLIGHGYLEASPGSEEPH